MSKATRIAWGQKDLQCSVAQKAKLKVIKFPNIFLLIFRFDIRQLGEGSIRCHGCPSGNGKFKVVFRLGWCSRLSFPYLPKMQQKARVHWPYTLPSFVLGDVPQCWMCGFQTHFRDCSLGHFLGSCRQVIAGEICKQIALCRVLLW